MVPSKAGKRQMYETRKKLILASVSPRRRDLLCRIGLTFEIIPADIVETKRAGEAPGAYVRRMAREKARAVGETHGSGWVVAADTIVCLEKELLGKPETFEEAVSLLMKLSGREHEVLTGYCLYNGELGVEVVKDLLTRVRFFNFSEETVRAYVLTKEPFDKAGAYGIQGIGGVLVEEVHGSYHNVVGLPLGQLVELLLDHGIIDYRRF